MFTVTVRFCKGLWHKHGKGDRRRAAGQRGVPGSMLRPYGRHLLGETVRLRVTILLLLQNVVGRHIARQMILSSLRCKLYTRCDVYKHNHKTGALRAVSCVVPGPFFSHHYAACDVTITLTSTNKRRRNAQDCNPRPQARAHLLMSLPERMCY